jgi:hypothetical protein
MTHLFHEIDEIMTHIFLNTVILLTLSRCVKIMEYNQLSGKIMTIIQ